MCDWQQSLHCRLLVAAGLVEGCHGYKPGPLLGPLFWPPVVILPGTNARGAALVSACYKYTTKHVKIQDGNILAARKTICGCFVIALNFFAFAK